MTFLSWLLSLTGTAICTEIHSDLNAQAAKELGYPYAGHAIAHIHVQDSHGKKEEKHILLQALSEEKKLSFSTRQTYVQEKDYSKGIKTPLAFELNPDVPVLDQGQYGTCITFATTGALDATLRIENDISQQCTLELLSAIGSNLWDGAYYSSQLIDPLKTYGAVSNKNCTEKYPNQTTTITLDQYKKMVDPTIEISKITYLYHQEISIEVVKAALSKGFYVSVGFGLMNNSDPVSVQGFDVVVNSKKYSGGLWACKQSSMWFSSNYCSTPTAGHEVFITGYDDTQQLFKIRNSWSNKAGYEGDFYMTYEFFTAMVMDGTEIY